MTTTTLTPALEAPGVTVFHGDCIEVMRQMPDSSIDAIVTDPPYGLEFMGKEWDGADGFRRSLNAADTGRDDVFGRSSRTSPEYRAGHTFQEWCEAWAREALRVLKPGGHMLAFGGSRTWHRLQTGIEDAGFEIRDSIAWLYGSGFPKSMDVAKAIEPVDADAAAAWEGWGTALKPAFEPIVVARKPLIGTVAANVLAHGTGALHIDACRIPTGDKLGGGSQTRGQIMSGGWHRPWMDDPDAVAANAARADESVARSEELGRWPTNVLIDDAAAAELDRQAPATGASGKASGPTLRGETDATVAYGARKGLDGDPAFHADGLGGASKFFPTFRYQAKPPKAERPLVDGVAHPTVKPVPLFRWLMRLVVPTGGVVLDMFAGSGTAVEAALLEQFEVIAIEREAEYLPLIDSRIDRPILPSLFGEWA